MRFFLIVVIFLNSSCIHLNSTEHQVVDLETSKASHQEIIILDKLQIENFVYTESVYPLEDFLKKLITGDFNDVLNKINFKYKPSNTDNKIILELIKEGLVPVYVNVKNTGQVPIKISEKNFYISDGVMQLPALSLKNIPRSFKRHNAKAIAANTYNIGVVVVGTVVALAVLGVIFSGGGFPSGASSSNYNSGRSSSGANGQDNILNNTQKTTKINYQKYLISELTIEPNKSVQGLLFFRYTPVTTNLTLKYQ